MFDLEIVSDENLADFAPQMAAGYARDGYTVRVLDVRLNDEALEEYQAALTLKYRWHFKTEAEYWKYCDGQDTKTKMERFTDKVCALCGLTCEHKPGGDRGVVRKTRRNDTFTVMLFKAVRK